MFPIGYEQGSVTMCPGTGDLLGHGDNTDACSDKQLGVDEYVQYNPSELIVRSPAVRPY